MKGIEALKKAATKPMYEESKGCAKEFMTLRFVLQLWMLKARFGWSNEEIVSIQAKLQNDNGIAVVTYIGNTLLEFQDRECVVAPYNFQYVGPWTPLIISINKIIVLTHALI
jgi:hypothetical protein